MEHVSAVLADLLQTMQQNRDSEIMTASEAAGQYVTDHNDKAAYRAIDREVNRLAKAWDKMIARLDKWQQEAERIESEASNFYGD